ncbi:MAG: cation:proton antiporter [Propionibacteriaceae bacterium]|nr:cation:proton antiporter [Propionibacteriaceae bacterium]
MSFAILAVIIAAALIGPVLAWSDAWRVPVVVGELAAGVLIGDTGLRWVDPQESTFTFLADIGFAMVMFVAGSRVPVRDKALVTGVRSSLLRLVAVVAAAVVLAVGVSQVFGVGHVALYAVLIASSSAAVIMPVAASLKLSGPAMLAMLPQVAVADAACIVALPLVLDPAHAGHAALGALAVIGAGALVGALFWVSEKHGWRERAHKKSQDRDFALELRVSLLVLLLMAALASISGVSIMLAGFALGLAVAVVGEPRRLARQLFALTEGLFAPIFFVWLGASLDLRALPGYPGMIVLGVVLGVCAVGAHAVTRAMGQPLSYAVLSSAQLGVPVAAATLGRQLGVLRPGEDAALLLGALVTIAAATVAGHRAARSSPPGMPPGVPAPPVPPGVPVPPVPPTPSVPPGVPPASAPDPSTGPHGSDSPVGRAGQASLSAE